MKKIINQSPSEKVLNFFAKSEVNELLLSASNLINEEGYFFGDGLISFGKNLKFLEDRAFLESYEYALERNEQQDEATLNVLKSIIWRKHTLAFACKTAINIEGDFVECGVNYGFGIDVIAKYLDFNSISKKWYLYDTFEGVPKDQRDDGFIPDESISESQYEQVKKKFSSYPSIKVIQGRLPEILKDQCPEKIAFLHIDLNNAIAELETLIALLPKVSIGGVVVLDDYGAMLFKKQCDTEKELFDLLDISLLELPTGQAMFIKTHEYDMSNLNLMDIINKKYSNASPSYPNFEFLDNQINLKLTDLINAYQYFLEQIQFIQNNIDKNYKNIFVIEFFDDYMEVAGIKYLYSNQSALIYLRFKLQTLIDKNQKIIDNV